MNASDYVVRLGSLCFGDFRLLEPCAARAVLADPESRADLAPALADAPDIELHLRRAAGMGPVGPIGPIPPDRSAIDAAQARLVVRFALLLLKHKAPPLYDCLPWHDWDISIVARRFRLWRTRLLLLGEGAVTLAGRLPRTAGIHVAEPLGVLRRYVERKARLDNVKRLRVLPVSDSPLPIPLPDSSVDLALLGSLPSAPDSLLPDLCRVAGNVILVENCPLVPPLDESLLTAHGFAPATVEVRLLGPRRYWQKCQ